MLSSWSTEYLRACLLEPISPYILYVGAMKVNIKDHNRKSATTAKLGALCRIEPER